MPFIPADAVAAAVGVRAADVLGCCCCCCCCCCWCCTPAFTFAFAFPFCSDCDSGCDCASKNSLKYSRQGAETTSSNVGNSDSAGEDSRRKGSLNRNEAEVEEEEEEE